MPHAPIAPDWDNEGQPQQQAHVFDTEVDGLFACTGCGAFAYERELSSKYGKPQLVGEIGGRRLLEAKCRECEPKPHKGMQSIWRER